MDNAWMIRNDGKAIACIQHIYANPENVEETLFAAEWLYINTRHEETRRLVLETVTAWAASISDGDIISGAQKVIAQKPYRFLSQAFVVTHEEDIRNCSVDKLLLPDLCKEVAMELNQEFLRARYGGIYNTTADCKEIYFRISSIGFDWRNIICKFLTNMRRPLEMIHIVRDEESTGVSGAVYLTLPLEDFFVSQIELKAPAFFVKGRQKVISRELEQGASLRQLCIIMQMQMRSKFVARVLMDLAIHENEYAIVHSSSPLPSHFGLK